MCQGISLELIAKLVLMGFDQLLKISSQLEDLRFDYLGKNSHFHLPFMHLIHDKTSKINTMKHCAHTVHPFLCLELLVNSFY